MGSGNTFWVTIVRPHVVGRASALGYFEVVEGSAGRAVTYNSAGRVSVDDGRWLGTREIWKGALPSKKTDLVHFPLGGGFLKLISGQEFELVWERALVEVEETPRLVRHRYPARAEDVDVLVYAPFVNQGVVEELPARINEGEGGGVVLCCVSFFDALLYPGVRMEVERDFSHLLIAVRRLDEGTPHTVSGELHGFSMAGLAISEVVAELEVRGAMVECVDDDSLVWVTVSTEVANVVMEYVSHLPEALWGGA